MDRCILEDITRKKKQWFKEDHWWWQANIIKHQNIVTLFWSAPLHYPSSQSYALSSVKFLGLKLRLCKKWQIWVMVLIIGCWSLKWCFPIVVSNQWEACEMPLPFYELNILTWENSKCWSYNSCFLSLQHRKTQWSLWW